MRELKALIMNVKLEIPKAHDVGESGYRGFRII